MRRQARRARGSTWRRAATLQASAAAKRLVGKKAALLISGRCEAPPQWNTTQRPKPSA